MKRRNTVLSLSLFLFAYALLLTPLYGQGLHRARRPAVLRGGQIFDKTLGLSDEQRETLESLREAHMKLQEQFREKAENLRSELRGLREDLEKNRARIENIEDELFDLRIEQIKSQYAHSKEIKKALTAEQLEKLPLYRRFQMGRGPAMNRAWGRQRGSRGQYPGTTRGRTMRPRIRRW